MAKMISNCPQCGMTNEVESSPYMRLDMGRPVVCKRCALRFRAALSKEDVDVLFESGSVSPVVKGEKDYILKSMYYPKP